MIARDHEFETRRELEEILAHKARLDLVAAGENLDSAPPSFLGFACAGEARAAQASQLSRVAVVVARREGLNLRRLLAIAEKAGDGRQEHAFAVGARAVEEHQRMLARHAGERIAEDAPKVGSQLGRRRP